jgi:glutamate-1-semialdehyde 2,1-aminomutase
LRTQRSEALYSRARRIMVGGVSSPVRAFKAVGGTPLFLASGKGSAVWDADRTKFTEYVPSWGPRIVGHAHPRVIGAVTGRCLRPMVYTLPPSSFETTFLSTAHAHSDIEATIEAASTAFKSLREVSHQ